MIPPLISVIIPVYNVRQYIKKCLDTTVTSAMRSFDVTGSLVEIICVDDGATDGSGGFLDEYANQLNEQHVIFKVLHQKNQGVSVARNNGLDHASGEWVRFLDGDDWVDCGLDAKLAKVAMEEEDTDFIAFTLTKMEESGKIISQMGHDRPPARMTGDDLLGSDVYSLYAGTVANKILRRSVIEREHLRFLPGVQPSEDDLFNMLFLSYDTKARICPDISGYCYRMTPGSAVHTMTVRKSMFLADQFHGLYCRWKEIRTPGLGRKLAKLAKELVCLGTRGCREYRKDCIEALLRSAVFNEEAIPYLCSYGDKKSRAFAIGYSLMPKLVRRFFLFRMFRYG